MTSQVINQPKPVNIDLHDAHSNGSLSLSQLRKDAMNRFHNLGYPTTRDEAWKYTSVKSIAQTTFQEPDPNLVRVTADDLKPYELDDALQLVFINGRFAPKLSSQALISEGVTVSSLAEAIEADDDVIQAHFEQLLLGKDDAFSALNSARFNDGLFVVVAPKITNLQPIHALFVTVAGGKKIETHPRNLIAIGSAAQVTIIEQYVSLGDAGYFSNPLTELVAGEDVTVDHYKIIRESHLASHIGHLYLHQSRGSTVLSHTTTMGGALVRNNFHAMLAGEDCDCDLNGLSIGIDSQHIDNHLNVIHAKPNCDSKEVFRGIFDDKAHGVFTGRIFVAEDAQKTDAKQTTMNLLLSEDAQVDMRPQLEIFADDVKCTHGATVGELDEDALFYMRSRGLSHDAARALMIFGFAAESLACINNEAVRNLLRSLLLKNLPHNDLIDGDLERTKLQ